jgi:hypothetical protein
MAADNTDSNQINLEIFRNFAEACDVILKLFIQNSVQNQTKEFNNKKVDELKNFNQLLYQAAEMGAFLEKIIQKQARQTYFENKLEEFRMMEKQIEKTLREKNIHELAANDPNAAGILNQIKLECEKRIEDINNKIEKIRENIAQLTSKLAEKHAQIKEDNKSILNHLQTLFIQARQYLSENPSVFNSQINGEETKVNAQHYMDKLQEYLIINNESLTQDNFQQHLMNFSQTYTLSNFSHKSAEVMQQIAQNIFQALPNVINELPGLTRLMNSIHTRDTHVAETKVITEALAIENHALNNLVDNLENLYTTLDSQQNRAITITAQTVNEIGDMLDTADRNIQEVNINLDLAAEFLRSVSSNLEQGIGNPLLSDIYNADLAQLNLNADLLNLDANPDLNAGLDLNAELDLNAPLDLNAELDLNAPLDLNAELDLNAPLDLNAELDLNADLDLNAELDLNAGNDDIPDIAPPAYNAEPAAEPEVNAAPNPENPPPAYSPEPEPNVRQTGTAKIADLLKIKITNPANQAAPVAEASAAARNNPKPPSYDASLRNNQAAEPQNNPEDQPPSYSPRHR